MDDGKFCNEPQAIWHGDGEPDVPILFCSLPPGHGPVHFARARDGVHAYTWSQPGHLFPADDDHPMPWVTWQVSPGDAIGTDTPAATCHVEITSA